MRRNTFESDLLQIALYLRYYIIDLGIKNFLADIGIRSSRIPQNSIVGLRLDAVNKGADL